MPTEVAAFLVAAAAFILSLYTYWHTTLRKGKPQFTGSRWTAIRMTTENSIRATFTAQISVTNKSGIPLEIKDFLLEAKTCKNQSCFYEPLFLFDLTQLIEDLNKPDAIGRAQKGQIPLPQIVQPNQSLDFSYPILFLPINSSATIEPITDSPIIIKLYCLTYRSKNYEQIARQEFSKRELSSLADSVFSGVRTTGAIKDRPKLLEKLRKSD